MTPEERAERRRQKILARAQNNPIIDEGMSSFTTEQTTQRQTEQNTEENNVQEQQNISEKQSLLQENTPQNQQEQEKKPDVIQKYKLLKKAEQQRDLNRKIGYFVTVILALFTALDVQGYLGLGYSVFSVFVTFELIFSAYRIFSFSKTMKIADNDKDLEFLGGLQKQIPPKFKFLLKIAEYLSKQGSNISYIADEICAYFVISIVILSVLQAI